MFIRTNRKNYPHVVVQTDIGHVWNNNIPRHTRLDEIIKLACKQCVSDVNYGCSTLLCGKKKKKVKLASSTEKIARYVTRLMLFGNSTSLLTGVSRPGPPGRVDDV